MDVGEVMLISSRLAFGAVASFLAIVLWSKTRDVAWMLIVIATIAAGVGGAGSSQPGWACTMLDDAPRASASVAIATQRVLDFMTAPSYSWGTTRALLDPRP